MSDTDKVVPFRKRRAPGEPAVPQHLSVEHNRIFCLDCGVPTRTLSGHLLGHGLSPEEYRRKWGLPEDYPMMAPALTQAYGRFVGDPAAQERLKADLQRILREGQEARQEDDELIEDDWPA